MSNRIHDIISIPVSLEGNFFRYWIEFLQPFHHMKSREMDIAAALLKERYLLSKVISDDKVLDKITLSLDTKKKIMKEYNLTSSNYHVVLTKLRKAHFIEDNRINEKFIPNAMEEGDESHRVLFDFAFTRPTIEGNSLEDRPASTTNS